MSAALILTSAADQSAEQRFVWELEVMLGHGIAPYQKTVGVRPGKKAVKKKLVLAYGKHDLTGAHIIHGTTRDLDDIVRPESGQHALSSDLQTQMASEAQAVCG